MSLLYQKKINNAYHWLTNTASVQNSNYPGDSDQIKKYTGTYGEWYSAHRASLSGDYKTANAKYVTAWLYHDGWSFNATMALLGNLDHESNINPGIWEGKTFHPNTSTKFGIGLTQWTNYYKLTDWCHDNGYDDYIYDIDKQLSCASHWDMRGASNAQYSSTSAFPIRGPDFKTSDKDITWLAGAFASNYERPASMVGQDATPATRQKTMEQRGSLARGWAQKLWNYWKELSGTNPPEGGDSPEIGPIDPIEPDRPEKDKIPIWLLMKLREEGMRNARRTV